MSNVISTPLPNGPASIPSVQPTLETYASREAVLTEGFTVARALPQRGRRLVGPWCFLDHFAAPRATLGVGPHPHIGLQTVTWLLEGEVVHRDSLGNVVRIEPGELNVMTSGHGITHAEHSAQPDRALEGLQLWIALPDAHRAVAPSFEHHAELPVTEHDGIRARIVIGRHGDATSPARVYSPAMGAQLEATRTGTTSIPLDARFEYAAILLHGNVAIEGTDVHPQTLVYLGSGRDELRLRIAEGTRAFLFGGIPLGEKILMWWNFVARTADEIAQARADWEAGRRFGPVTGLEHERIAAPPLTPGLRATS